MNIGLTKKGFTLIEVTLVIILISVLILITTPLVSNVVRRAELNSAHESLYNSILRAQNLSKIQYRNQQWRVCIDNTAKQYVITAGSCASTLYPETIKFSSNITISSTQTLDILFKSISGELDNTSNYPNTITLTGGGASKSIIINKKGILSKSPTAEEIAAAIPPPKLAVTSCTYADKKISIPYTAGQVGYNYASQTINSTGVTGLTATLVDGPLATGGDTVTDITVGTDRYRVHKFTTVGTSSLNVIQGGEFEYLVVGGGGGGGGVIAGGGGGGGMLEGQTSLVSSTNYSITVGGGGVGGLGWNNYPFQGTSGGNSSITGSGSMAITSIGGGGGGGFGCGSDTRGALSGGSGGGGGSCATTSGAVGTAGQGNAGGNGSGNANTAGGGGGAGSAGVAATSTVSGAGGSGRSSSITGSSITYAGGGGGGVRSGYGTAGAAGSGGGGVGSYTDTTVAASNVNGSSNTGGGGGGCGYNGGSANRCGGNGGSGIVVVRYKLATATGGTLASTGTLQYVVTGTPSGAGTANFDLSNIGNTGVGCNSNIAVNVTETVLDSNYNNVSLLINGNGTNGSTSITDSSSNSNTVTAFGNSQISNVQSKFGGSSVYFDGSGDYLRIPVSDVMGFGSGDYTVEAWVYGNWPSYSTIFDNRTGGSQGVGFYTGQNNRITVANNSAVIIETGSIPVNTWTHVAISRQSNVLRAFINGVKIGEVTDSRVYGTSAEAYIGDNGGLFQTFAGYMDDLRVTKGVARYNSNFTPTTTEFPTSGNILTY